MANFMVAQRSPFCVKGALANSAVVVSLHYGHAHDPHDQHDVNLESGLQGLSNTGQAYLEVINGLANELFEAMTRLTFRKCSVRDVSSP